MAQRQPLSSQPTHAGGVVYRELDDRVDYLLVRANSAEREWVFPKGHIERGESTPDAAVREVHEEAAVRAEIIAPLDTIEYTLRDKRIRVQFYLMRALRNDIARLHEERAHAEREYAWLSVEDARDRLAYDAYRELLTTAELNRPVW